MSKCALLLVACILLPRASWSQDSLNVKVQPVSTLRIHGTTNINTFVCDQTYTIDKEIKEVIVCRNGQDIIFSNAELRIPVENFDCGHKIMTKDFREILEAEKNPYLRINLRRVKLVADRHIARVNIVLAGVSKSYDIPIKVVMHGAGMTGIGECRVRFSDFDLDPPVKFMGMVKVREELDISFNIRVPELL